MEATARLVRRADDDELGSVVFGDLGQLRAERPLTRAHDLPADAHPVRVGDRSGVIELAAEMRDVEVRVERELLRDDERSDEYDARAAVGGEAAREVERMLGLRQAE